MATFSIYNVDKSSMVLRDACASLRQLMKNKQRAQGMNLLSQAQELCNNVCQQNLPLENSIAPLSAYKESSIQVLLLPPLHLPTPLYSLSNHTFHFHLYHDSTLTRNPLPCFIAYTPSFTITSYTTHTTSRKYSSTSICGFDECPITAFLGGLRSYTSFPHVLLQRAMESSGLEQGFPGGWSLLQY